MGKSRKKQPICRDKGSGGSNKQRRSAANRKVRRMLNRGQETLQGNAYKKIYETWNICDYTFRMTKQEAIENYYRWIKWDEEHGFNTTITKFPTEEDYLNWWEKAYIRK